MKFLVHTICVVGVLLCLAVPSARASVVIAGTRVVFPAQDGKTTVRLKNQSDRPALVQAWIDNGNLHSTPDTAHTPFLITPPVFRMNAHTDQSLRIIYIAGKKKQPSDRESLFWLNVLEIPPKPTGAAAQKNRLQFAIRSRLKLFYRPKGLPGSAATAPDKLTWTAGTSRKGATLTVHNPTPYYVTIASVSLTTRGHQYTASTGMVAPFDDLNLTVKHLTTALPDGTRIHFATINDFGGGADHTGMVK